MLRNKSREGRHVEHARWRCHRKESGDDATSKHGSEITRHWLRKGLDSRLIGFLMLQSQLLDIGLWCHTTHRFSSSPPILQHYSIDLKVPEFSVFKLPICHLVSLYSGKISTVGPGEVKRRVSFPRDIIPLRDTWFFPLEALPSTGLRGNSLVGLSKPLQDAAFWFVSWYLGDSRKWVGLGWARLPSILISWQTPCVIFKDGDNRWVSHFQKMEAGPSVYPSSSWGRVLGSSTPKLTGKSASSSTFLWNSDQGGFIPSTLCPLLAITTFPTPTPVRPFPIILPKEESWRSVKSVLLKNKVHSFHHVIFSP